MRAAAELQVVLKGLSGEPVKGVWARAVAHSLLLGPPPDALEGAGPSPLWPGGPARVGARFTPKRGAPSIYLAETPTLALLEVGAVLRVRGREKPAGAPPFTVVQVDVRLQRALDCRNPLIRDALGTDLTELRAPWRLHRAPPTQTLGACAAACGRFDGLVAPSAQDPEQAVLIVFPQWLSSAQGTYCEVIAGGPLADRWPR